MIFGQKLESWTGISAVTWLLLVFLGGCSVVASEGAPGVGAEGEPCSPWGSYACNPEGNEELLCEEGWYVLSRSCPGGCTLTEEGDYPLVFCNEEVSD